ncbi:MAG: ATP-binding protein, partial [Desulfovibrionales bacterium]
GVPIGTIGYTQDISARKTAEIRLQENEEKFRKTFRSSPDVMTLTTFREGRFLDVNQTFCEVTGYSREEALGRTAVELDIWVDSSHRDLLISRLQERGRVKNQLTIFRTKSGEERHFLVSAERIEIGGVESIILGAKDISERVHMEDALKEAKELLEVKVKERTFELEKANNAKDTFLANMSHEMRTPLSGILGMAELSLDQHVPDEVHDNLEMIRYSAKALSTIIDDLLDFSAIQFQRLAIKSIEVLLRDELEKMLGGFEEQAKSKGLFFSVTIQDDVPRRIISDPDRVRQIIINFLNNAIKFTQKGGIHLDVRRTAPDHLAFSVSDTGIGFPPDRISDIFESFTQLDATITKRFGGTGLGLAVSKNLAELMGGTIEVESEEGKGSVFTLIIPVEVPQEMKRVELPPAFDLTELRPLRILLAEDNPVNQTVIRKFLTKQGHTTTVVVDGRQVLDELKNKEFDLVLMDVQMPEMDGIEATRNIRSGISGVNSAEIPVIALTAYAMKGDREKFLRAGMDGYVSKPVDFKELAKAIFDAIGSTVDEQEKIES